MLMHTVLVFLLQSVALLGQTSGRVTGIVRSNDNKPVSAAMVHISRIPATTPTPVKGRQPKIAPGEVRVSRTNVTGADGAFQFSELPAGAYQYCVTAIKPFVNSCQWDPWQRIELKNGILPASLNLTLAVGAVIQFVITDPTAAAVVPGMGDSPNLLVGVRTTSGAYHAATIQLPPAGHCVGKLVAPDICEEDLPGKAKKLTGKTLELTVPPDAALQAWVHGPTLRLVDEKGTSIGGLGPHTTIVGRRGIVQTLNITVLGSK